ncbi:hypothetical protein KIN20_031544 [Parelaphostrongylus tenuis]|uniref:NADH-ubiquinone oxidoreductase subunit B14.7 n=1 Tax=Parelaphostrongylus tenuis TaxID=148309 RepID=A0AAD5R5P8_PARTN|nr:hypothetical protein KIN20_031544 [Parelaphostrongylus tenuis]
MVDGVIQHPSLTSLPSLLRSTNWDQTSLDISKSSRCRRLSFPEGYTVNPTLSSNILDDLNANVTFVVARGGPTVSVSSETMVHDFDTPLVATYKPQRPPWVGLWSRREYKGRPDWWKEAGLRDDWIRSGKFRTVLHRYKEEDPEYFDPKVPDGTSLSGPFGLDSRYHPNLTIKTDQPGSLKDFQTKVWKGSHQYKAIAEKYDLSEEHPGFDVSPTLNNLLAIPKAQLGRLTFHDRWYHLGPRFFDKPLNEASHEKGLACAKYAALLMLPYTMLEIRATASVPVMEFSPRAFVKRYFQLMPKPTIVAFTWGFALSAASVIRNKDDVKNHMFSSAAVGAVVASLMKDNIPMGLIVGGASLVLGILWQYSRMSEEGIQGRTMQPTSAGMWGGPIIWKGFQWGDAKVPETRY